MVEEHRRACVHTFCVRHREAGPPLDTSVLALALPAQAARPHESTSSSRLPVLFLHTRDKMHNLQTQFQQGRPDASRPPSPAFRDTWSRLLFLDHFVPCSHSVAQASSIPYLGIIATPACGRRLGLSIMATSLLVGLVELIQLTHFRIHRRIFFCNKFEMLIPRQVQRVSMLVIK